MKQITKLQKPLNCKGWFYENKFGSMGYDNTKFFRNWYNSLSLRRKITLRNSGEIELPF